MSELKNEGGTPPLECELSCKCTAALTNSVLIDMILFNESLTGEAKGRLAKKVNAGLIGSPEALLFEMQRLKKSAGDDK